MSTEPATQMTPAKTAAVSPRKTFQTLVDSDHFRQQISAALPKHITPERFIRVLMTATMKTPKLLECTQESLFKGIFDCAALGLELDGRRAHLVPLRNNKKNITEANLWLDYKGIAELVMRSGMVSNIHADVVCENDVFEYDRGELKKHTIDFRKPRGPMYAVYCIIRMKDGGEKVEVMGKEDVDRIRAASRGANEDPWRLHYNEQAKKTVFKRASKWVPLSAEVQDVLDKENDDEPVNVTPKPSLAGLLAGTPTETPTLPPAVEQEPATEVAATEPAPEAPPAEPAAKTYTAEERAKVLAAVETGLLQWEVGETRALKWATENGHRVEGQDEVGALSTPALLALLDAIPTLKKGGAK